jgi:hypothetical protein
MTMAAIQHVILHRDGWPQRFPATGAALLASPDGKLQVRFDGVTNEGFDEGVDTVDALLREAEKGLHLADLITAHQQLLTTTERLIAHPALPRIERLALIAGMRGTILAALAKVGLSA